MFIEEKKDNITITPSKANNIAAKPGIIAKEDSILKLFILVCRQSRILVLFRLARIC
jgi:hypothetical protein